MKFCCDFFKRTCFKKVFLFYCDELCMAHLPHEYFCMNHLNDSPLKSAKTGGKLLFFLGLSKTNGHVRTLLWTWKMKDGYVSWWNISFHLYQVSTSITWNSQLSSKNINSTSTTVLDFFSPKLHLSECLNIVFLSCSSNISSVQVLNNISTQYSCPKIMSKRACQDVTFLNARGWNLLLSLPVFVFLLHLNWCFD